MCLRGGRAARCSAIGSCPNDRRSTFDELVGTECTRVGRFSANQETIQATRCSDRLTATSFMLSVYVYPLFFWCDLDASCRPKDQTALPTIVSPLVQRQDKGHFAPSISCPTQKQEACDCLPHSKFARQSPASCPVMTTPSTTAAKSLPSEKRHDERLIQTLRDFQRSQPPNRRCFDCNEMVAETRVA